MGDELSPAAWRNAPKEVTVMGLGRRLIGRCLVEEYPDVEQVFTKQRASCSINKEFRHTEFSRCYCGLFSALTDKIL